MALFEIEPGDNKFVRLQKEYLSRIYSRPSFIVAENAYLADLAKNIESPGSVDIGEKWNIWNNPNSNDPGLRGRLMTEEQEKEWTEWLQSRPLLIRKLAGRVSPFKLYKIKATGSIGFPIMYKEGALDGDPPTIVLAITTETDPNIFFERNVMGLLEEDLEEVGERQV